MVMFNQYFNIIGDTNLQVGASDELYFASIKFSACSSKAGK